MKQKSYSKKKKMNVLLFLPVFFLMIPMVIAEVVFTEILYDPTQCADADCEWIEVYNNGSMPMDISPWKLNGADFDDLIILPGEFVVIARDLIDSAGGQSFESVYGNNDGIWNALDGNYRAIDGNFQLANTAGTLNLSSPSFEHIQQYNSTIGGNGNGRSIIKSSLNGGNSLGNWQEGSLNGTPGYFEFSTNNQSQPILTLANITNVPPAILSVEITPDESALPGIQLAPNPYTNTTLSIKLNATDNNGVLDITKATASLNNTTIQLNKFLLGTIAVFNGSLLLPALTPGFYNLTILVTDASASQTSLLVPIEILQLLTITINQTILDFGKIAPGSSSLPQSVAVANTGTTPTNVQITSTDLISTTASIPAGTISVSAGSFNGFLSSFPTTVPLNLAPGAQAPLAFTLQPPTGLPATTYFGAVTIAAIAP